MNNLLKQFMLLVLKLSNYVQL